MNRSFSTKWKFTMILAMLLAATHVLAGDTIFPGPNPKPAPAPLPKFPGFPAHQKIPLEDVQAPEPVISLTETDIDRLVWNGLVALLGSTFVIAISFLVYYCIAMRSDQPKVKWQKVSNLDEDMVTEEEIRE
eukprot:302299_1